MAVMAAVLVWTLAASVPAHATDEDHGGLWYFDWFDVQDAHDAGITGEGVTIAMIDSPVNLDIPTLRDADVRVQESFCLDENGVPYSGTTTDEGLGNHGTNVLSLLVGSGEGFDGQQGVKGIAPGATVLTYAMSTDGPADCYDHAGNQIDDDSMGAAIDDAVNQGARIISVSLGQEADPALHDALAAALRNGVIVVAGLSNDWSVRLGTAPGTLNGVVSVLGMQPSGDLIPLPDPHGVYGDNPPPNTSEHVDVVAPGTDILIQGNPASGWREQVLQTGNSLATPIVAANLALAAQKYPQATGNQLIQSLIHNTGREPHDLDWDDHYGYGVVVTPSLLAADPTQYEDVNPLIDDDPYALPSVADIFGAEPGPSASPTPAPLPTSPAPTPSATDDGEGDTPSWLWPAVIGGSILLVLVVVTVAITVIAIRRRTTTPEGS